MTIALLHETIRVSKEKHVIRMKEDFIMKYVFKRIDEIDLRAFERQIQQQYAALNVLLEGKADTSEILSYVEEMIADGRPCKGMPDALFWGFDEPENMPGDARIDFFYMPTYLNTAFLMQAFRMMPELICERVPDFKEKLGRAMTACSGRGFSGHSYDKNDFVRGMQIFASVRTKEFIRSHREIVPEVFRNTYCAALRSIERDMFDEKVYQRRIKNSWECDHLKEYREILAMENAGRHTLFVYGSLMKGGYNHPGVMADAEYLGSATVTGFDMYDLGSYPGIRHTKEQHVVRGELYDVSAAEFDAICILEGNGSLYQCETVPVELGNRMDWIPAEVFVYLGNTDGKRKISGKEQYWTERNKRGVEEMEYIWYACYGSNINRSRFMLYINKCGDKTPPMEDRPFEFDHPVFFAGKSSTWGGKGKAFLDMEKDGHALGRIYKITREQYADVKGNEGADYNREINLGELDGIPVVTFTCVNMPKRSVPSPAYLDTILDGLKETYPEYRESALAEELINGIFSEDEVDLLDCLREAEHGLTNREIREKTGMSAEKENEYISALAALQVIRQDRRTLDFEPGDERAVFYTMRGERDLIDRVRILKQEAEEMRSIPAQDPLTSVAVTEGGRRQYLTTRYERVPSNRQAAIRIHGTTCQVCGFNFFAHYGELGRDYIEVHHIRPLSSLDEEVSVDPAADLVCLCANCHRMMHRTRADVMTVEELRRRFCP